MFSKAKTTRPSDERAPTAPADVQSFAPSTNTSASTSKRAPSPKPSGVPSLISADMVINGNISTAGEVQLDGTLEGDIKAGSLIVGDKAAVKGEIICENVMVRGRVIGGIRAKQVALATTAHIEGDILHSALSIESGAHFEGNCRHSDDPLSEAAVSDFRKPRHAAPPPAPTPRPVSSGDDTSPTATAANSEAPSFLSQNRSPLR